MTLRFFHAENSDLTYIRTSKCAGMTMQKTFLDIFKYERVVAYPADMLYAQSNSTKFVVVRNPWDRLVSQYEYCRKHYKEYSLMFFEEWFFLYDKRCVANLANKTCLEISNFYLKFEDLQNEVNTKLPNGEKVKLSHFNASDREFSSYEQYYTSQEMVDTVAQLNKYIIEQIGYDF